MRDHPLQLDRRAPDWRTDFPCYTTAESTADGIVHVVGLTAAAVAIGWLLNHTAPEAAPRQLVALVIYCCGLLGMLSVSAAYNLLWPGRLKAVLRRLDHAMIFAMIAGSYTPFTLGVLRPQLGIPLCAAIWGLAAIGIGLKLQRLQRGDLASVGLYIGMGWLCLTFLGPLFTTLPGLVLLLLLVGGLIYSLGALVHARAGLPFHNAVWHAMVVAAAALHFAAVAQLSFGSG